MLLASKIKQKSFIDKPTFSIIWRYKAKTYVM